MTYETPIGANMFAYCGNNPIMREDSNGCFWILAATKFATGVATQYAGDVLGNIANGKSGRDIFKRTSTNGEYLAAGVTALIPGSGLRGALIRNVVSEGISVAEDVIKGNKMNVATSMLNIGLGTLLDSGFEKLSNSAVNFINSKTPQTYSEYAHTARQSNPNLTRQQIYQSMQRSIRFGRVASNAVSRGFDIIRSSLSY